jgi:hypothetical protein
VEAVLGLVPDGGVFAIEKLLGDLLAGVGWEAVEDNCSLRGFCKQLGPFAAWRGSPVSSAARPGSIRRPSGEATLTSTPAVLPMRASDRATLLPSPT